MQEKNLNKLPFQRILRILAIAFIDLFITMDQTANLYCVILAGGKGRRLWPSSRQGLPKQFIDFFGTGRTQLQQTFDRILRLLPARQVFINTNKDYVSLVREQLPDLPESNILAEPVNRNTAPSVAWACHRIRHINPSASLMVMPSDLAVLDEEAFRRNVFEAFDFVNGGDGLLAMGIKPTRPEPGYGYIQVGAKARNEVYQVQSFTEKPEREFAKMFLKSGEFWWNTGMFFANAAYLWRTFERLLPAVLRAFDAERGEWTEQEETEFIEKNFPSYPNMSLDAGILEKSEHVFVMKCDFGWADLGTWHGIYEAMRKGEGDNVSIHSDVYFDNSRDNVVKLPEGKFAIINGLDGYIVAEEGNVLLICKKEDSSALVRKYVNEVQLKKGEDFV